MSDLKLNFECENCDEEDLSDEISELFYLYCDEYFTEYYEAIKLGYLLAKLDVREEC